MEFWDAVASAGPYANNLHLAPDRFSVWLMSAFDCALKQYLISYRIVFIFRKKSLATNDVEFRASHIGRLENYAAGQKICTQLNFHF